MPECSLQQDDLCYGGNFTSKGGPRMGEVKNFQPGTHINQVSERLSGIPLPIETFLHIHTWHTKYPKTGEQYSLEFNIKHAGIAGKAWSIDTPIKHKWNANVDWTPMVAQEDLLELYHEKRSRCRRPGVQWALILPSCPKRLTHATSLRKRT